MSYFGGNLKKIRAAKKLNQTAFANLFGITRSTVGAYEEERAEPKLDKVVEIANYFGINITNLLTKKLSINEILHFDSNRVEQLFPPSTVAIAFIDKSRHKQYIENYNNNDFISRLPKMSIPQVEQKYRAFEYSDSNNFLNAEVLICKPFDGHTEANGLYLHITKENLIILEGKVLKTNILEVWAVEYVLVRNLYKLNINIFLQQLDKKIDNIQNK